MNRKGIRLDRCGKYLYSFYDIIESEQFQNGSYSIRIAHIMNKKKKGKDYESIQISVQKLSDRSWVLI